MLVKGYETTATVLTGLEPHSNVQCETALALFAYASKEKCTKIHLGADPTLS
jgi:hypothetical protein